MNNEKLSYIYVAIAIFLWASTAAIGKLLLNDLDNFQVLFYSSLFAFLGLFGFSLFLKKIPEIKKYNLKDYIIFAGMGFVGVFLYYVFFYAGLTYSSAQEAFIVNYTWPIWVVIFSMVILKEKFHFKKIIAIVLGFIGVYIATAHGVIFNLENLKGVFFALLGAISYGLFSVYGKKYHYDKILSMMFYYFFSFVFITITTLIYSEIPSINIMQFIGLVWLGVFTGGIAFVCWFLALKYGDTAKISNFVFLTPFLSLIYIYFLLDEKIMFSSIIGLGCIVVGIIIQAVGFKKINPRKF